MISEKIEQMGYPLVAALALVSVVLGVAYAALFNFNALLGIVSMGIAVFGSYFLFSSFFEEEKPLPLKENEKILLRTLDVGSIVYPKKKGGFFGRKTERDLSVYLTDRRILARRPAGEFVFDRALDGITCASIEKRVIGSHIKLSYVEGDKSREALLFVGKTDLWEAKLRELKVPLASNPTPEEKEKKSFLEASKDVIERVTAKK